MSFGSKFRATIYLWHDPAQDIVRNKGDNQARKSKPVKTRQGILLPRAESFYVARGSRFDTNGDPRLHSAWRVRQCAKQRQFCEWRAKAGYQ